MTDLRKPVGILALISLIATTGWLVLTLIDLSINTVPQTPAEALAYAQSFGPLQYANYLNATLLTFFVAATFAGLSLLLREEASLAAAVGLVFVPVYAAMNVTVYFSQVSILPRLVALLFSADITAAAAPSQIPQWVQLYSGSVISVVNLLAYGILAIPSILFGAVFVRHGGLARWTGLLLIANGIACLTGVAGVVLQNPSLTVGTSIGGGLFLLALILMSIDLLRTPRPGLLPR